MSLVWHFIITPTVHAISRENKCFFMYLFEIFIFNYKTSIFCSLNISIFFARFVLEVRNESKDILNCPLHQVEQDKLISICFNYMILCIYYFIYYIVCIFKYQQIICQRAESWKRLKLTKFIYMNINSFHSHYNSCQANWTDWTVLF